MNLIFLGSFVTPDEIKKFPAASVAGNKMQYNLLYHLSDKIDNIEVVSFEVHAKYPQEKKLYIRSSKKILFGNVRVEYLAYVNLPILKELSLLLGFLFSVKKLVKKDSILLSYNLFLYQAFAFNFFRKKVNDKCVCLLADLSSGNTKKGFFGKITRLLFDGYHHYSLKKCSYFIALNEYALKKFTKPKSYMIMDGGVESSEFGIPLGWNGKKNIVYSGALVEYSGILNLVNAMKYVKNDKIHLHIYGNGSLKKEIQDLCERCENVKYCGTLVNTEMLKVQQQAWLLANPRPVENDTAKVTFPSKIFEYMMSGRPVISTKLNGFSKDYDKLLFWMDDSVQGIACKINELDGMIDEVLNETARNARNFMLKNKSWEQNSMNVYRYLEQI